MVEAVGVEPTSEEASTGTSPSAARSFHATANLPLSGVMASPFRLRGRRPASRPFGYLDQIPATPPRIGALVSGFMTPVTGPPERPGRRLLKLVKQRERSCRQLCRFRLFFGLAENPARYPCSHTPRRIQAPPKSRVDAFSHLALYHGPPPLSPEDPPPASHPPPDGEENARSEDGPLRLPACTGRAGVS